MKQKTQTVLLRFGYRGKIFHGLQAQPGLPTVERELRARLEQLCNDRLVALNFAGRTDAGVSANQNAATFRLPDGNGLSQLLSAYKSLSCEQLWVTNALRVPRSVNARNSVLHKLYRYRIRWGSTTPHNEQTWAISPALNVDRMRDAALQLTGTHDFSAFRSAGCGAKSATKTVNSIKVIAERDAVRLDITGTRFLRRMVRIMAGTLAEVGAGLLSAEQVLLARESKRRAQAGITAPATGLTLERIWFGEAIEQQLLAQ